MTPYFHSFAEFIAMGEHGRFVWMSFGLTFLFIIGMILYSKAQRNKACRDILTQQSRQQQRRTRLVTQDDNIYSSK